jgi:hypothetical protein
LSAPHIPGETSKFPPGILLQPTFSGTVERVGKLGEVVVGGDVSTARDLGNTRVTSLP